MAAHNHNSPSDPFSALYPTPKEARVYSWDPSSPYQSPQKPHNTTKIISLPLLPSDIVHVEINKFVCRNVTNVVPEFNEGMA